MGAAQVDFNAEQGATFYRKLTILDNTSNPIDLTGSTFRGKVKKNVSDVPEVAHFTFNILNQSTNRGQVEATIPATIMGAIGLVPENFPKKKLQNFVYDIEWVQSDNVTVWRVFEGAFIISPEVTR